MKLFGNMTKKCTFNVKKNCTNTLHENAIDDGLGFEVIHELYDIMSLQWMSKE